MQGSQEHVRHTGAQPERQAGRQTGKTGQAGSRARAKRAGGDNPCRQSTQRVACRQPEGRAK